MPVRKKISELSAEEQEKRREKARQYYAARKQREKDEAAAGGTPATPKKKASPKTATSTKKSKKKQGLPTMTKAMANAMTDLVVDGQIFMRVPASAAIKSIRESAKFNETMQKVKQATGS